MKFSGPVVALVAAAPSLVSAALFGKGSQVKIIDEKGFRAAMDKNETSMVAFVAPWCGHCQKMAPEYSKAALGLYPLVPAYAVNCNLDKNKKLCAEQGVEGFPTVKLYPRGKTRAPLVFQQERTASGFWYFATGGVPNQSKRFSQLFEILPWIRKNQDKHRVLLLSKEKKTPLLWQVLSNKYHETGIIFASTRDRKNKMSTEMGFETTDPTKAKLVLYPIGSTEPFHYEGILKHDSISKFLDSVLDGTADLQQINEEAKAEELVITDEELEIQQKQEAQRIALMHGGFNGMVDFEKAVKSGAGANYHDAHGFAGMMGDIPDHLKKKSKDEPTAPVEDSSPHAATAAPAGQGSEKKVVAEQAGEQIVLETPKDSASGSGACPHSKKEANGEACSHHVDEL